MTTLIRSFLRARRCDACRRRPSRVADPYCSRDCANDDD